MKWADAKNEISADIHDWETQVEGLLQSQLQPLADKGFKGKKSPKLNKQRSSNSEFVSVYPTSRSTALKGSPDKKRRRKKKLLKYPTN